MILGSSIELCRMADATCSECDEYYKDPRMLPCLHTFCLQCLEKQVSQDTLHCPNCKEMITLSENEISDLPQDLHKAHEAEIAWISERVENANELCEICGRSDSSGGKAVAFCIDCDEFLCTFCKERHSERRKTTEHNIVTVGERLDKTNEPGIHSKLIQQKLPCDLHKSETSKVYCKKCEKLICRDCMDFKHKDHRSECFLLDDVVREEMDGLKVHLERSTKALVSLDEAVAQCKQTVQQIETKKKEVDTAINQNLDQIREKLLTQNREIQLYKVTCVEAQMHELQRLRDCLSHANGMIKDSVKSHTPLQQLSTKKILMERAMLLHKRFEGSNLVLCQCDTFASDIANPDTISKMIDLGLGGSDATSSTCDAGYLPRVVVGKPRKIMVVTRNKEGKPHGCGRERVEAKLILKGSQEPAIIGEAADHDDGSYSVSVIPQSVGKHELHVTIRGKHVRGSPFIWHVSRNRTTKLSAIQQCIPTKKAPIDVAVTEDGCLVVAEQASHTVTLYTKTGNSVHSFGAGDAGCWMGNLIIQ